MGGRDLSDKSRVEVDPSPGNYYVSVKDAGRMGLLLGPFRRHAQAIGKVPMAKCLAEQADPFSVFYSFGTVKMSEAYARPGVLNQQARRPGRCGGR